MSLRLPRSDRGAGHAGCCATLQTRSFLDAEPRRVNIRETRTLPRFSRHRRAYTQWAFRLPQMQKRKRYAVKRPDEPPRNSYAHSVAPFLSKITFHWVTDLLSRGYRAPLELHDLSELPDEETTRKQFERFRDVYETERVRVLLRFRRFRGREALRKNVRFLISIESTLINPFE